MYPVVADIYTHKKLPPKSKTTLLSSAPPAHISFVSLSIYFSPLPSPPSLNRSRSHPLGGHPSFVLFPPLPLHLHLSLSASLSVFCQHLQGEAVPTTSHPSLLHTLHFPGLTPSTCREAALLFLLQYCHLHLSVCHPPSLFFPVLVVHPFFLQR